MKNATCDHTASEKEDLKKKHEKMGKTTKEKDEASNHNSKSTTTTAG